jgi:hypothetical protein
MPEQGLKELPLEMAERSLAPRALIRYCTENLPPILLSNFQVCLLPTHDGYDVPYLD